MALVWKKLVNISRDVHTGSRIACPELINSKHWIEMMVFDPMREKRGLAIVIVAGYGAGTVDVVLPEESMGEPNSISADWLIKNWDYWMGSRCEAKDVLIAEEQLEYNNPMV